MSEIMIDIKSTIEQIDGEEQVIEMVTEGELFEKNGSIYLMYHESEVSGMEGSRTMLKIDHNIITMTRFGGTKSKIVFEVGHPMNSVYHTPYGAFDMHVETELLEHVIDVTNLKGHINIKYQMVLEQVSSSKNHLEIRIK